MTSALPKKLYTCEQTRALDKCAIESFKVPGIVLMKRAGKAAFRAMETSWPACGEVVVLCGTGNNGGDGFVVAGLAARRRIPVKAYLYGDEKKISGDARRAFDYALQEGVSFLPIDQFDTAALGKHTVIVDGLLGTGFTGELRDDLRAVTAAVNRASCNVLALDMPTGLSGDTGLAAEDAIVADKTITFIAVKRGMLTGSGRAQCGDLLFNDLDVPAEVYETVAHSLGRVDDVVPLSQRRHDSHKKDFGHVVLVGGDQGMGGAIMLASESCLRSGAGMVSTVTRSQHVAPALSRVPEIMTLGVDSGPDLDKSLLEKADMLVIGPGLGQSTWSRQMLHTVLNVPGPKVIDADALNLIAQMDSAGEQWLQRGREEWVITPHPGEAARLLGCSVAEVQADRFEAAKALQEKFAAVVVLKGSGTVIAGSGGLCLANVGGPAMAAAGMGDVLAGVIAALYAQGLPLTEAAVSGVCAHGRAGEVLSEKGARGVAASDLIPQIRQQLNA